MILIFTGPTLSAAEGWTMLDAVYLPPVGQGDVYRASLDKPRAIGIIDGYFERIPAVWHKEILWAMSQGIHVFGSASMGALRAAELSAFGMEGVGAIFEDYASGKLEDDDEVAVSHGPEESGYRVISEAMVNIRATLAAAESKRLIKPKTREQLLQIAKFLHYSERTYEQILRVASKYDLPYLQLKALREFVPDGRVDRKHDDALSMLRVMRARITDELSPKRVDYGFVVTDAWQKFVDKAGRERLNIQREIASQATDAVLEDTLGEKTVPGTLGHQAIVDELCVASGRDRDAANDEGGGEERYGDSFENARRGAQGWALASELARRQQVTVTPERFLATLQHFCQERGLDGHEAVTAWCESQHLDRTEFTDLMAEYARVRWIETVFEPDITNALISHLRIHGDYGALAERAQEKQQRLIANGLESPTLDDIDIDEEALWQWYFISCVGQPVAADIGNYAHALGFRDRDALRRVVLREYCFVNLRARAQRGDNTCEGDDNSSAGDR